MTKTEPNNALNFPGDTSKTEIDRAGGLRTKRVGLTAVFTEISKQIGLWADAESAFGPRAVRLAHALAYHRLMTEASSLSLFAPWAEGYLLPSDELPSGKDIVAFEAALGETGETQAAMSTFFAARAAHAARFGDEPLCAYDLSSIAANGLDPVGTAFGLSTGGAVGEEAGLGVVLGLKSGLPVRFSLMPGGVTDASTAADLLWEKVDEIEALRGKERFGAVLEAKHFDMPNLARAVDEGKRVLFTQLDTAATPWISEAVEEAVKAGREEQESAEHRLPGEDGWGITIKKDVTFDDGRTRPVWVHVFRFDFIANAEQVRMFMRIGYFEKEWSEADSASELRKRALKKNAMLRYFLAPEGEPGETELVRDFDAIDAALDAAGITVSVSTMPCSAEDVIETYRRPGTFEACFLGGREEPETALLSGHGTKALTGRFLVGFLALSIRNELLRRVRKAFSEPRRSEFPVGKAFASGKPEKPQAEEVIFDELRNVLDTVEVVFSGSDARYCLRTDAQKAVADKLGCPGVFDRLPECSN